MLSQAQVGRFEVRDFLGRGAIGDVYLAWDPEAEREVALKVVRKTTRSGKVDPEMLEAEKNGVSLQQQLSSVAPQVAAVYGWGDEGDLFWVAMEYVDGRDLSQVLAEGRMEEARAIPIALQICEMLEVCHRFSAELGGRRVSGIVHGDIKPENLRLQERPDGPELVRVLDFGIAKQLSQTRRFTKNLFGSLPYTPPERLDRVGVDRQSDLWALGIILYLMVSGVLPFAGEEAEEVERKIRQGEPPEPLPGDCPQALQKIVHRSLAFDPAKRYESATALRADLEAYRDGRPLPSEAAARSAPDLSATRRTAPPPSGPAGAATVSASPPVPNTGLPGLGTPSDAPAPPLPPVPPLPPGATRRTGEIASGSPTARTSPPPLALGALGATRRTGEIGQGGAAAEMPPPAPPPLPDDGEEEGARPWRRSRAFKGFALAAGLGFVFASQAWVRSEAREIRRELITQSPPDVDAIYSRYRAANRLSLQGRSLGGAREELRAALVKSADRVIESYHGDSPSTTENGWRAAHDRLEGAIDLDDRERATRAKLRYTSGHLLRIAAQTLRTKGSAKPAAEKMRDAVADFKEAAQLAPDWPDPYLGLARVYSYETFNFGELQKALDALQQRSYPFGRRETAMLADGHRMYGNDRKAQADVLKAQGQNPEQEISLLEEARTAYEDSLSLYGQIPGYANARANRAKAEALLEAVNERLSELEAW